MYLDFFGLRQQPFGVTPDPAFLYLSRTHQEALDALRSDLLNDRGFLTLVGDPGLGKTTLLYKLLDEWSPTARVVFLFQTQCDSRDFFRYLLAELGVDPESMGLVAMHHKLNHFLFQEMLAGRRFVLIVDEAQNLDDSVLETVRGLSNFETQHAKLLNIVLAGQSQLADKLATPGLRQLRQRIGVLNRLHPLTAAETAEYVRHRLALAGRPGDSTFTSSALHVIAQASQGAPRTINHICHQALSAAATEGVHTVNIGIAQNVIARLEGRSIEIQPFPVNLPVKTVAPILAPVQDQASDTVVAAPVAAAPAVDPIPVQASAPVSTPSPAPSSTAQPASPPAMALSYGWSRKATPTNRHPGVIAFCFLLLVGGICFISSVRGFAWQEYQNLTATLLTRLPGSVAASSPELFSSPEITQPARDSGSENAGVIVVSPKAGQSIEDLSRLYVGRFDQELYQQIAALNPNVKDFGHLDIGQLIELPLPPGTLKRGVDTDDSPATARFSPWQAVVAKVRGIFSSR